MNRIAGTVALLLALCLALPAIAELAQAAVPALGFCLVLLGILRIAFPPRPRGGRRR